MRKSKFEHRSRRNFSFQSGKSGRRKRYDASEPLTFNFLSDWNKTVLSTDGKNIYRLMQFLWCIQTVSSYIYVCFFHSFWTNWDLLNRWEIFFIEIECNLSKETFVFNVAFISNIRLGLSRFRIASFLLLYERFVPSRCILRARECLRNCIIRI